MGETDCLIYVTIGASWVRQHFDETKSSIFTKHHYLEQNQTLPRAGGVRRLRGALRGGHGPPDTGTTSQEPRGLVAQSESGVRHA